MKEVERNDGKADCTIVAIIPLYNGAEFIERSIRTVLSQTRLPDEFIVVDDGSTDDGAEIVQRLAADHPLIQLISKENGGQSSARNLAVAESTSSLIALLDQDDGWYPDHLEKLLEPFQDGKHFRLGWVYSNLDECDRFARMRNRRLLRLMKQEHPKTQLSKCLADDMFILPSASLISRVAFEAVGGFDERLSGYEDDDLFVRLFHEGWDNVFLDEALSYWCIYPDSTSYSPRMAKSRMIYFKKLYENFEKSEMNSREQLKYVVSTRFYITILSETHRAYLTDNKELYRNSVTDIDRIIPFLPENVRQRAKLRMMVMRSFELSRFLRRTGVFKLLRTGRTLIGRRNSAN